MRHLGWLVLTGSCLVFSLPIMAESNRDRNGYQKNVEALNEDSKALQRKLLARKYGGPTVREKAQDGYVVTLIKVNQ